MCFTETQKQNLSVKQACGTNRGMVTSHHPTLLWGGSIVNESEWKLHDQKSPVLAFKFSWGCLPLLHHHVSLIILMLWPLVPLFCLPMETLNLSETLNLDPNNWWIYHPPTSPNAAKESNHMPNLNHFCKDLLFTWVLHVQTFGWICPKTKEFLDQFCTQNLSCWPQRMLSSPPLVTGMLHNETWNKQMHLSFMSTCIKFGIVIKLFPKYSKTQLWVLDDFVVSAC